MGKIAEVIKAISEMQKEVGGSKGFTPEFGMLSRVRGVVEGIASLPGDSEEVSAEISKELDELKQTVEELHGILKDNNSVVENYKTVVSKATSELRDVDITSEGAEEKVDNIISQLDSLVS